MVTVVSSFFATESMNGMNEAKRLWFSGSSTRSKENTTSSGVTGGAVGEHGAVTQGDLVGGVVDLARQVRAERRVDLAGGGVEFGEALHRVPVDGLGEGGGGGHGVVAVGAQLV